MDQWSRLKIYPAKEAELTKLNSIKILMCLRGRLGNQLFQLASAIELENKGYRVFFDLSAIDSNQLELLDVPPLRDYVKSRTLKSTKYFPATFGRFPRSAQWIREIMGFKHFYQNLDSWEEIPTHINQNTVLDGYWQNLSHSRLLSQILKDSDWLKSTGTNLNTLGVHIRLGDFISENNSLPFKYFRDLILNVTSKENFSDVKIFSDDITACKENLKLNMKLNFREGQTQLEDLKEMINCTSLIISRSTFAWWAATISGGRIYCPTPWYRLHPEMDKTLIPKHWICVES